MLCLKNLLDTWNLNKINSRYKKIVKNLSKDVNKRKINIIFVNCEASKWAYQYIYEKFAADDRFNVKVVISVYDMLRKKKYNYLEYEKKAKENYDFFKNQGMNVEYAYNFNEHKYIELKKFAPDIVFYDEPPAISKAQSIDNVSKYALTMYCSYGSCITNGDNERDEIYKKLFVYFVDNNFARQNLIDYGFKAEQVYLAGQPKTDAYLKEINIKNRLWKTDKKHIIIAPHFSFDNNTVLRFGTFNWNYKFFFNYAKEHNEYEFIFKPHPSLKREIIKRNLMTVEEMNEYYKSWKELPNAEVYESGNYIDMFRTSDLLITDCNSFLFEYLPTLKPVIQLINPNSKGHNEFGQKIIEGYYKAKTIDDIEYYLDKILVKNEDNLLYKRKDIIKNILMLPKNGVNTIVYDYVNNILDSNKGNE
ncbi:CDP-glycerol glycerophosphotransferase family protein [bacterium]|nr:CDP-glycerol glycerophosphotransferase family protein [bacterium]